MLAASALLATLASLMTLGSASPLPQVDEVIIIEDVPASTGRQIRWFQEESGTELCYQIDARTGPPEVQLQNGAGVNLGDCFDEGNSNYVFQSWVYNSGSTKICIAPNPYSDTQYCIDFGSNLGANGQYLKIWQAYEGLPAQQLYITDDNHIAVENGPGQCADVRAESGPQPDYARPYGSRKDLQSWQCDGGNPNQIFIFPGTPTPPGPGPEPEPTNGRPITWTRESDGAQLCLQVNSVTGSLESQFRNGGLIGVNYCFADDSDFAPFQRWVYNAGSTKICVAPNQYTNTQYCIDFGSNLGSNGQALYIWQGYEGLPAQQLYITDDNHIAVENGPGQCADVRAESGPGGSHARPFDQQKDVQSWQCTFGNANQIFGFPA